MLDIYFAIEQLHSNETSLEEAFETVADDFGDKSGTMRRLYYVVKHTVQSRVTLPKLPRRA